jgi:hypothetical protein
VLEGLARENIKVSKASVCRWAKGWKAVVHRAVDLIELPLKPANETATAEALADIPAELRQTFPDRLLHVARGKGLDRVEEAIRILSDAIARRASELVSNKDPKALRTVVGALATMASAMESIVTSRATVATAHRSYSEGDRLLAEADRLRAEAMKLTAEAEIMRNAALADNAKNITPCDTTGHGADREFEDEAIAIVRALEGPS